jgi:hypothetical protein
MLLNSANFSLTVHCVIVNARSTLLEDIVAFPGIRLIIRISERQAALTKDWVTNH